jgi:predicted protein tyrosine phosphatase
VVTGVLRVCPVGDLRRVTGELDGFDLLTLLSPDHAGEEHRGLACGRHLELRFNDIVEPRPGLVLPDRDLLAHIIEFGRKARLPMVIHCWAGISRSSAAAYVLACDRSPGQEGDIADELRRRAPFATPNRLMVALADDLLGREGRMVAAIERIGRGAEAAQGTPYQLPLCWPIE